MCGSFISSYKTLMLSNLVSPFSPGANCEDLTDGSLTNYKNLFSSEFNEICNPPTLTAELPRSDVLNINTITDHLRQLTHSYIAGFITKKIKSGNFNRLYLYSWKSHFH